MAPRAPRRGRPAPSSLPPPHNTAPLLPTLLAAVVPTPAFYTPPPGANFSLFNLINVAAILFMWTAIPAFGAAAFCPTIVLGAPVRRRHARRARAKRALGRREQTTPGGARSRARCDQPLALLNPPPPAPARRPAAVHPRAPRRAVPRRDLPPVPHHRGWAGPMGVGWAGGWVAQRAHLACAFSARGTACAAPDPASVPPRALTTPPPSPAPPPAPELGVMVPGSFLAALIIFFAVQFQGSFIIFWLVYASVLCCGVGAHRAGDAGGAVYGAQPSVLCCGVVAGAAACVRGPPSAGRGAAPPPSPAPHPALNPPPPPTHTHHLQHPHHHHHQPWRTLSRPRRPRWRSPTRCCPSTLVWCVLGLLAAPAQSPR
jgi:hypothetical protein